MSKRKKSRKTTRKGPGRYYRRGITIFEVFEIFPNDTAARLWFEKQRWGDDFADFHCPRCGCLDQVWETPASSRERTPYYCGYCQRYFNVRTNTVMQGLVSLLSKVGGGHLLFCHQSQGRLQHEDAS